MAYFKIKNRDVFFFCFVFLIGDVRKPVSNVVLPRLAFTRT